MRYVIIFSLIIFSFLHSAFSLSNYEDKPYEELILELRLNTEYTDRLSMVLEFDDGSLLVPIEDIEDGLRIKKDYLLNGITKFYDMEFVDLKKLEGTKYEIDMSILLLDINFPPRAMEMQYLNAINRPVDESLVDKPIAGAYINYDFNFSNTKNSKYIAGVQDINYFTESHGNIVASVFLERGFSDKVEDKSIRLDTNWTLDNPATMAKWRVGDSITKNADWSSSTRFAGVQYANDFEIAPEIVTYPLVDFLGSTTLPTNIDIYTKSRSIYTGKVKPGEFEIGNIPIPTGAGDFTVETRDITGQIQEITIPYYISPVLLKQGLQDYSFAVGMQRQDYGRSSNEYRNPLANIDYMYGVSNSWTTGAHFEIMNGKNKGVQSTAGITNKFKIANYGVVTTSAASNIHKATNQAQKLMLGYRYNNSFFNFGTRFAVSNKNFDDTYIDQNQNVETNLRSISTFGFTYDKVGTFSFNYLSSSTGETKLKILSANFSRAIFKNDQLRISLAKNLIDNKDSTITVSYNMNISNRKNLTTSVSRKNKEYIKQAQFSSNNSDSKFSYRGRVTSVGSDHSYNISATQRTSYGNLTATALETGNNTTQQLEATGSIVFMDGDFFLSKPIYTSLAVVKVAGYSDIPVYSNNHFVANTNKKGKVFVPNVIPFATSTIRIDANKLPLDAHLIANSSVVAPNLGSGVLVNFDIKKYRSVIGILVDENGNPFEENHVISIKGLDKVYSGYDGLIYLEDIGDLQNIKGAACKQGKCYNFDVDIDPNNTEIPIDLGTIKGKKL